jgi:hypothetical protein
MNLNVRTLHGCGMARSSLPPDLAKRLFERLQRETFDRPFPSLRPSRAKHSSSLPLLVGPADWIAAFCGIRLLATVTTDNRSGPELGEPRTVPLFPSEKRSQLERRPVDRNPSMNMRAKAIRLESIRALSFFFSLYPSFQRFARDGWGEGQPSHSDLYSRRRGAHQSPLCGRC